jgi:uncharacterized membrane protein
MSKFRLEALSDAVFGIVLTLLVIEIRVPEFVEKVTESKLIHGLEELLPLFFAYFLSFMIISTQWFSHSYFFSIMTKTLTRKLVNYNFIFLAFLSLIPFSSHLLGRYPQSRIAVFVYALNIFLMSILTWIIREYIYNEPKIENPDLKEFGITQKDLIYGVIRIGIGTYGSLLAVALSFVNTYASIAILLAQAIILAVPGFVQLFAKITTLDKIIKLKGKWAKTGVELEFDNSK